VSDTWASFWDVKLINGPGDTLRVFYVQWMGYRQPVPDTAELRTKWGLGDSWSTPEALERRRLLGSPGVGVDPRSRIWVAWYNGDYLVDMQPDEDTWGIWTCIRDSGRWGVPELAIRGPDTLIMNFPAGQSFAADRDGNWYMGIQEETAPYPDLFQSAMYSRLEADTWIWPRDIARGWGSPLEECHYLPALVPHPDSGFWTVHGRSSAHSPSAVMTGRLVGDSVYEDMLVSPAWAPEALRDSLGRLRFVFRNYDGVYCACFDTAGGHGHEEISTDMELHWMTPHICCDPLGWVWVGWTTADTTPVVCYQRPGGWWSNPEPVTDFTGWLMGLTADSDGRVYAMFRTDWYNWYTTYRQDRPGVVEKRPVATSPLQTATVARGVLMLPDRTDADLLDIIGRKVMDLRPGENDIRHLAPGVYFVRRPETEDGRPGAAVRKVVIQR
jgi:hypothetical protein